MGTETDRLDNQLAGEFEQFGQTERKILAAAVEVFAEKGFDGARTDEIAAKSGVNKAMIYYYFKSKDNLYTVIVETIFGEVYLILSAHLSHVNVKTPEEGIRHSSTATSILSMPTASFSRSCCGTWPAAARSSRGSPVK